MRRPGGWRRIPWVVIAAGLPLCVAFAADPAPPPDAAARERAAGIAAMRAKQAAMPDTPGTGRFAALKEETSSLPDHVIYRPADLKKLGATRLGVYVFGNGSCTNDGASARLHLLEIASHGYLAIAPGRIRTGPGATVASSPEAAPRVTQGSSSPEAAPRVPQGSPPTMPPPPTSHTDLLSALDWALAQNADPQSSYYRLIDPKAVAVSGYSCGGLQALQIAADPRIKTVIVMNSGIFNDGGGGISGVAVSKSLLDALHTPTLYILGGKSDIAYANGMDDVARINHVPLFAGNISDVGHGGTYWEPNGGKAATAVVAWLNWQLRGDTSAAKNFVGKDCGLCRDSAWVVEKKRID